MAKIKKDDTVLVIAGKDRGTTGKVLSVDGNRVTVEGVNRQKRHTKETTARHSSYPSMFPAARHRIARSAAAFLRLR